MTVLPWLSTTHISHPADGDNLTISICPFQAAARSAVHEYGEDTAVVGAFAVMSALILANNCQIGFEHCAAFPRVVTLCVAQIRQIFQSSN